MSNGYKGNKHDTRNFEIIDYANDNAAEIVKKAEHNADIWFNEKNQKNQKKYEKKISMTKVRKFFSAIKNIELNAINKDDNEIKNRLLYLKPLIAYYYGRENDYSLKPFYDHLIINIDNLVKNYSKENFAKIIRYFEGLISYYLYKGGRNI